MTEPVPGLIRAGKSPLQLVKVYLVECHLVNHQDVTPLPKGQRIDWQINLEVGHRIVSDRELRLRLKATLAVKNDVPQPFDVSVDIVGVYHSKTPVPMDIETVQKVYMKLYTPLIIPHMRETLSSLTNRMGGPVINLPVVVHYFNDVVADTDTSNVSPSS